MRRRPSSGAVSIGSWYAVNPCTNWNASLISDALTLLANAVIAYNTWKLHRVLERRKASGGPVPSDEILAHIAPIAFRHINFHDTYRFPLERYLDRLIPSAPGRRAVRM